MNNGILISIEGPDTSGKSTQAQLLKETLEAYGRTVEILHFPNDESPYGKLIRQLLTNKEGELTYDQAYAMQLLYVADQQAKQDYILSQLKNGVDIIIDRYDLSTMVYTAVTLGMTKKGRRFVEDPGSAFSMVSNLQTELIKPDFTIVLTLPAEEIKKRKDELDRFESNEFLMSQVAHLYELIGTQDRYLFTRPIIHVNAKQSVEEVQAQIMKCLELKHKLKEILH